MFLGSGLFTFFTAHGTSYISNDPAVCVNCHKEHEKGEYGATIAGTEVAKTLRQEMDKLKAQISEGEALLAEATRLGMEVRTPRFELRNAVNALTNARVEIHGFKVQPVKKQLDEGMKVTAEVQGKAQAALEAIRTGRAPLTDVKVGYEAMQVALAAEEGIRRHQVMEFAL